MYSKEQYKRKEKAPFILCIMDGWGLSNTSSKNAIKEAKTPNFDKFLKNYPSTSILASGEHVGLPRGQVGNSEVGHMNIGAGRVIKQNLLRIDEAIKNESLYSSNILKLFCDDMIKSKGRVHLLGLVSNGGVHSKDTHLLELVRILTYRGLKVIVHAFTDGRDTLPKVALQTLLNFQNMLPENAFIGSVMGRFFSMDRDNRWERIAKAWETIVLGKAEYLSDNLSSLILEAYSRKETDEFISPTIMHDKKGKVYKGINDGDGLIVGNFRSDRMQQLLTSLVVKDFKEFNRTKLPNYGSIIGMVPYSSELSKRIPNLFPREIPKNTIGEVLSNFHIKQCRIAETEKFPHITFFLNGGEEKIFKGEDRILISSPKVKTYDTKPHMSAKEISKYVVKNIIDQSFEVIIINFANPDMVGHTGNFKAVIDAVQCVDKCVGEIVEQTLKVNGSIILTSDHGNSEVMWDDEEQSIHTAHTNNPVPLILIGDYLGVKLKKGRLADISPTLLDIMNLKKPSEMEGESLII